MNTNISLSIIFLCHNNINIDICINAVLEQIKANDELIVVDDHSDEHTLSILNSFSNNKSIVLLSSDKVANRSYNRNLGAKVAKNNILVFLDGDMVIGNNSLSALRNAYATRKEVAYIGQKHAINYDPIQLELFSKIENYIELLRTHSGRAQLESNPLFIDARKEFFENENNNKFHWIYYYTGLCSVQKDVFFEIGGFDEHFSLWGSEDVDLGYRINQRFYIGFVSDFHGFHIPHNRNVIENELSNKKNIQYMLHKYKDVEVKRVCKNSLTYHIVP